MSRISLLRRILRTSLLCSLLAVGLLIVGCDSGGSNGGGGTGGGGTSSTADVDKVGETATVEVKESSGKLASKAGKGGIVTVLFFYGQNSDGSTCFSSASTEVVPPTTKKISPGTPKCASGSKTGISVSFVSLGGSSSSFTLELRGDDGSVVASASSSDGEVSVEGGTVPSSGSGSGDSDSAPAWTGTWVVTAFGNQQVSNQEAYRITESRWSGVYKTQDGGCNSFSDPIIDRDPSKNTITTLRDDGRTPTYKMSTSGGTLTAETVGGTSLPNITADTTGQNLTDEINCTIDTDAPSAPSGLSSTAGDGSVSIGWSFNATEPVGFYVYRATSSIDDVSNRTPLNSQPSLKASFTDTTATNGTTYYYAVTAVDSSLNESAVSGSVSATPSAGTTKAWTGNWEIAKFYDASADTSGSRTDFYYSLELTQFESIFTNETGCQVEGGAITSINSGVEGDTITIDYSSAGQKAVLDVTNGRLTLTVVTPKEDVGDQYTGDPVSSDPRDILNCSSTKSLEEEPGSTLWNF